ncbi:MAG: hypothetical protein UR51_C0008G0054 [Candidatus Moranbacteria bacterium GW2011_GWF1_34_10]|nr:MAG: hypothetical protein UR51_C0008G0054 [Candidatus Moranbacteria bacterium GW2011_GWF1_34_10]
MSEPPARLAEATAKRVGLGPDDLFTLRQKICL